MLGARKTYLVSLSAGIQDLDVDVSGEPAPKSLVPFQSSFTTFEAKGIDRTEERFGSSGIAVLDDRAFLVENFFSNGALRVFDISDPMEIREIESAQNYVNGRPVDIAADRGLVAVATAVTNQSRPSNLWIFDVSDRNQSIWVGAASVANSAVDGAIQRVALKNGLAYALTLYKGLQVVDLDRAIANFHEQTGGELFSSGYFAMVRNLNTNGQGFAKMRSRNRSPLSDRMGVICSKKI